MDADNIIRQLLDDQKKDYPNDDEYNVLTTRMAKANLNDISDGDIEQIVKTFLYDWGRMNRFLAQSKNLSWQTKVKSAITSNSMILKRFQSMNIKNENLNDHKDEIEKLYESFKEIVGRIASAKILHLICPSFFPLWDIGIANGLRWELKRTLYFNKSVKAFSAEDYFRFMVGVKSFLLRHNDLISSLSRDYQSRELKIIDMCFWQAKRRPFFLIF